MLKYRTKIEILNCSFSRKNPSKAQELEDDKGTVTSSNFDPKRLTKIIIHGYADSANEVYISDYLLRFRDEYLKFADVNVIVVDYSVYAMPMMYFTSLHEVVAEKLTDLIEFLVKNYGVKLSSFHILGMSWGAHVAGVAGHTLKERLGSKLGRISGLDPAGPLFKFVDNEFRLDKEDAEFVDIIHSNGGTRILFGGYFGLKDALGHVDAYPNGGSIQIGCPQGRTLQYESERIIKDVKIFNFRFRLEQQCISLHKYLFSNNFL